MKKNICEKSFLKEEDFFDFILREKMMEMKLSNGDNTFDLTKALKSTKKGKFDCLPSWLILKLVWLSWLLFQGEILQDSLIITVYSQTWVQLLPLGPQNSG